MANQVSNQSEMKKMINAVRSVVSGPSNNDITLVLLYYDNNVDLAIQAFLRDGAKAALQEWTTSKPVAKKNKRPRGEIKASKPIQVKNSFQCAVPFDEPVNISSKNVSPSKHIPETAEKEVVNSQVNEPIEPKKPHLHSINKPAKRHGRAPEGHVRERTISEMSSTSTNSEKHKKPLAGIEKSVKVLQRQSTALHRVKNLFNDEVNKSHKQIKLVFEELHSMLNEREVELLLDVELAQSRAANTLSKRENEEQKLKKAVNRAQSMSEAELNSLRSDIKAFVSDRKTDEGIRQSTHFSCDMDSMKQRILSFGKVAHVKDVSNNSTKPVNTVKQQKNSTPAQPLSSPKPSPTRPADPNIVHHSKPSNTRQPSTAASNSKTPDTFSSQPGQSRPHSAIASRPQVQQTTAVKPEPVSDNSDLQTSVFTIATDCSLATEMKITSSSMSPELLAILQQQIQETVRQQSLKNKQIIDKRKPVLKPKSSDWAEESPQEDNSDEHENNETTSTNQNNDYKQANNKPENNSNRQDDQINNKGDLQAGDHNNNQKTTRPNKKPSNDQRPATKNNPAQPQRQRNRKQGKFALTNGAMMNGHVEMLNGVPHDKPSKSVSFNKMEE